MSNLHCGWNIRFHSLFAQQYKELKERVIHLQTKLPNEKLILHPDVKLFKALYDIYTKTIPSDPFAQYFVLNGNLKKYSRVKKKGLPDNRYRLFFKVFKDDKTIVILWLGYPRKEGSKDDCYKVFEKMVLNENFPDNIEVILKNSDFTDFS